MKSMILYTLFFVSGVAALIYQVVWQRMLFTLFGVDLISTSIIVSVFMFGLGMGGLLGGRLADACTQQLLKVYIAIEVGIALFGFASPYIIHTIGSQLFSSNEMLTAVSSFLILAIPTILMGATFPVLVMHVNLTKQNIGDSVGGLYFVNTLGGATGAYLVGFVLLSALDMIGVVNYAAWLNIAIAATAFIVFRER